MCIDAKNDHCWKNSPTDTHIHFPSGSNFQQNRNAVVTGLTFKNTLCTWSERSFPILMENNKNHPIRINNAEWTDWVLFFWRGWSGWTQMPNTESLRTNNRYHLYWWTVQWFFSLTLNSSSPEQRKLSTNHLWIWSFYSSTTWINRTLHLCWSSNE